MNQITSLQQQQNQAQQVTKKDPQVPIFRETRGKRRKVLKEINVGDNYRINSRKKRRKIY